MIFWIETYYSRVYINKNSLPTTTIYDTTLYDMTYNPGQVTIGSCSKNLTGTWYIGIKKNVDTFSIQMIRALPLQCKNAYV